MMMMMKMMKMAVHVDAGVAAAGMINYLHHGHCQILKPTTTTTMMTDSNSFELVMKTGPIISQEVETVRRRRQIMMA